jgi:DNA-binding MarR family transcriptional regulator
MSTTTPTFSAPILGQTEKALNAILDRLLAGTGLTELQWVTLTITSTSGDTVARDELIGRVAHSLRVSEAEAQARIAELAAAQLVQVPDDGGSPVKLTDAGEELYSRIRAGVNEITGRMWGDLPAEDLDTAGRVLSIVLERANAELAAH